MRQACGVRVARSSWWGSLVKASVVGGAAAVLVTSPLLAGAPQAAAAKATRGAHPARTSGTTLTRIGHVTFWECPASTTEMLVAVSTVTLHRGATLDISFTVRNMSTKSCSYTAPYASAASGPTASTLQAGPCGSVGFEVVGPNHKNVWPGTQVVNCPALGFAQLAPNATISGTGTWDQTKPNSTNRVPTGRYTLVVTSTHFSFPLRVVSP